MLCKIYKKNIQKFLKYHENTKNYCKNLLKEIYMYYKVIGNVSNSKKGGQKT